jgi:hypothetical protein
VTLESSTISEECRPMDQSELEVLFKNIDKRTARIEQILPTLATKDDLKGFPTTEDARAFAMKDDLKVFATKKDLEAFATKKDLEAFATKEDVKTLVAEEGARTRLHFDVVAEQMKSEVKLIAEGQTALTVRVDRLEKKLTTDIAAHDKRLLRLEAAKRR